MESIIFRSLEGGMLFNEEFFVNEKATVYNVQMLSCTETFEIRYKSVLLGIVEIKKIHQYSPRGITVKYNSRNLSNQEELLHEWWEGIKISNQINQ